LAKIDAEMTNNKQQTAVEWLMNQALSGTKNTKTGCLHIEFPNKALQQAKEMEKEQIAKAFDDGDYNYHYSRKTGNDFENGEEYFKELYGGNK
jgi:hypothetical protein